MTQPRISIVVPVFNEEPVLPQLLDRLTRVAVELGEPYEIIFVNDGSRDRSFEILAAAARRDASLVVVDLNRNYGQHAALFAGFEAVRGEIVVTLDADLQNPPEEIPKLVRKLEEGYDVVGTVRMHRRDTLFRRVASRCVNKLTAWTTGVALHDYGCMLRAYRRGVIDALCASGEASTFIPVLAVMFAGRVTEIPVEHAPRVLGKTKYSLRRLLVLQFDLLTSFTVLPLRITMAVGVVTALLSLVAAVVLLAGRIVMGSEWAIGGVFTVFAVLFVFLGILLFAIGLLGEYVGRIYTEVRRRPRYVVRRVVREEGAAWKIVV